LLERTLSLAIDKAYSDLKVILIEKGCTIVSENPPRQIIAKQGSIWGISRGTAKKLLEFNLVSDASGTKITCSSRLSADWKNLTIIGCALAAALVGLCLWINLDLSAFTVTHKPSFWSWLVSVDSSVDSRAAQTFMNLTVSLAVFLSVIIILEIVIAIYVHAGIDRYAEQVLGLLSTD
jgi:hypothetical protein